MKFDRNQAIQAALQLLDDEGLEKLTIRALGSSMAIQGPSLYYYFPSKRVLLDAMADAIVASAVDRLLRKQPDPLTAEHVAREFRRAMLDYRDGAQVVSGSYSPTPNVLQLSEMLLGVFLRHGMARKRAVDATFNLTYFVQGFVLEEQSFIHQWGGTRNTVDKASGARQFEEALGAGYPHLTMCLDEILAADFDARFEFGLETFISKVRRT